MPDALDPVPLLRHLSERGVEHIVIGGFAVAQGGNFRLITDLGDLDVMQWVSGIEAEDLYAELERDALEGSIDGISVRVCGLAHLRAMKQAAGRPQDLEDLRRLADD